MIIFIYAGIIPVIAIGEQYVGITVVVKISQLKIAAPNSGENGSNCFSLNNAIRSLLTSYALCSPRTSSRKVLLPLTVCNDFYKRLCCNPIAFQILNAIVFSINSYHPNCTTCHLILNIANLSWLH